MPNRNRKVIENIISKTKIYIVIIAVLMIALAIYDIKTIIPSIIMFVIILWYSIVVDQKRKAEISKHIHELIVDVDSTAKSTLINSPFPLVIMETDGNIIWKSSKFVDEFYEIDINNYLDEIIKEVKQEIENSEKTKGRQILKHMKIGKRTYKILGQYVNSKKDTYMMTLYFIDNTEMIELLNKYNNSQTCVGIVMVDNYEETMQRIPAEERPQAVATLEKTLYDWAGLTGGLMVKAERDTFVYIFDQEYLSQIESSKFSILDTVKELKIPSKQQLTVSIAISNEGNTNYQKYKSALSAMDIALGRGGDQAVIRENEKYTFFGGRTQELEKRTKVKARIIAQALTELITASSNVMIMGHTNGDIDSMGSSLGMYRLAKTLGKEVNIAYETQSQALESFLTTLQEKEEYSEVIIGKQEAITKMTKDTLLIVVDTHKKNYVEIPELLNMTEKIAVVDHHRKSTEFIENVILTFHEVYASSTAELVTEILQYADDSIELKEIEIEGLYAGIMIDTKNFTFKTGVRTFEAAAYLRKCGVDIIKVKKWFQSDLETYHTISEIISKAEIVNDTIGIAIYQTKSKDANLVCAKAADELLTISNITASFVLGDLGDKICISGRSMGDVNVQVILEKLGGGGHITLAGAQIEGLTLEEAKQELIIRINEYFSEIG